MRPRRSFMEWFRKYFLEGQALRNSQIEALKNLDPNAPWYTKIVVKYRRLLGVLIPLTFVQIIWWSCAVEYNYWSLFPDRFYITVTMVFGSIIAGMTSAGGGAVAFPVMTLAFSMSPAIARDFSLMIQSVGMTAAAFTIFWMRIQLEWRSVISCSFGAILGMIIGLEFIDPRLTPPQKKMGFVSVWFAYAFALFLLNRCRKRKTFKIIPEFNAWKAAVLLLTGFLGGVFTAIAGSGVDICSFSILTLLFHVSEKTAMPTCLIVIAGNSIVGFYWRQVMMQAVHIDSYRYLAVCAPVVVLGGPIGSVIGSHFHRQVIATSLFILSTFALISSFAIVKLSNTLIGFSIGIIVVLFVIFCSLAYLGHHLMGNSGEGDEEAGETPTVGVSSTNMPGARDNEAYVISNDKIKGIDDEHAKAIVEILCENLKIDVVNLKGYLSNPYTATTWM